MDVDTAKKLIEMLIQETTIEINSIKSQVVDEIAMLTLALTGWRLAY